MKTYTYTIRRPDLTGWWAWVHKGNIFDGYTSERSAHTAARADAIIVTCDDYEGDELFTVSCDGELWDEDDTDLPSTDAADSIIERLRAYQEAGYVVCIDCGNKQIQEWVQSYKEK